MNLDELRSAQAKERRKDSLQHLRDSFYDDVAAYVEDLRAARDRRADQVAKPFSDDDVRRMSDEVETAEEVAEALYERRVGKVVKLASFAAADMPVDADGMTTEERQLFDDLVDRITENKSRVLDVLSGEISADETPRSSETAPADSASPAPEPGAESRPAPDMEPAGGPGAVDGPEAVDGPGPTDASGSPSVEDGNDALAGAMGGVGEAVDDATSGSADEPTPEAPPAPADGPAAEPAPAEFDDDATGDDDATTDGGPTPEPAPPGESDVTAPDGGTGDGSTDDRAIVRITRDVGAIFGVDEREYDLASEDVVTLPVENADPLVQRDAAERLD